VSLCPEREEKEAELTFVLKKNSTYACKCCGKELKDANDCLAHVDEHQGRNNNNKGGRRGLKISLQQIKLPNCSKNLNPSSVRPKHLVPAKIGNLFVCKICGKKCKHLENCYNHIDVHRGLTQCSICDKVLSSRHSLKAHMANVHKTTN
jgi:hypothetical protein